MKAVVKTNREKRICFSGRRLAQPGYAGCADTCEGCGYLRVRSEFLCLEQEILRGAGKGIPLYNQDMNVPAKLSR